MAPQLFSELPMSQNSSCTLRGWYLAVARAQHPWLKAQGAALDRELDSVVLSRIKKLSAMNKLKKAALVVMAQSLSEDEINGLQQLFRSIDADGNGTITVDELRTALSSLDGRIQARASPPSLMQCRCILQRSWKCGIDIDCLDYHRYSLHQRF